MYRIDIAAGAPLPNHVIQATNQRLAYLPQQNHLFPNAVINSRMAEALTKSGIHFDELNKIRILEPEVSSQTNELKNECKDFVESKMPFLFGVMYTVNCTSFNSTVNFTIVDMLIYGRP